APVRVETPGNGDLAATGHRRPRPGLPGRGDPPGGQREAPDLGDRVPPQPPGGGRGAALRAHQPPKTNTTPSCRPATTASTIPASAAVFPRSWRRAAPRLRPGQNPGGFTSSRNAAVPEGSGGGAIPIPT